jgi:UDP-N-acetylmuramate-alanine ligase
MLHGWLVVWKLNSDVSTSQQVDFIGIDGIGMSYIADDSALSSPMIQTQDRADWQVNRSCSNAVP